MKPIVVTGYLGRLGSAIYGFLTDRGEKVFGVSRGECDLSRYDYVDSYFSQVRPGLVFHSAAMTDVDACEREPERARLDNFVATRNVARAASSLGARLVCFSTDYVFDGTKTLPYVETDSPNPLSVYGRTKLDAEQEVGSHLDDYAILRLSWLFGAGDDFISFLLNALREKRPLKLASEHRGSPGYIPDVVPHIWSVAKSEFRGVLHLTNRGGCTRFEMGIEILRLIGSPVEPFAATADQIGFVARRPAQSVLSCEKFEETFSEKLRSWKDALHAYLKNSR